MRSVQVLTRQRSIDPDVSGVASALMRILVLDDNSEIIGQVENALWVWPHKVARTADVEGAVDLCRHLTPSAILVAVDRNETSSNNSIPALRRRLPTVPIIGVVSRKQFLAPGKFLDQGADALLVREDAHRPTLHDLVISVQREPESKRPATRTHTPKLALPWRQSEMLGALICDVTGSIVDANLSLAIWLGYPSTDDLKGRNVLKDLLKNHEHWTSWKQVAGDTSSVFHQESTVASKNGQVLWMKVEVFAAPGYPSHLQAVFVDLTELTVLTGPQG